MVVVMAYDPTIHTLVALHTEQLLVIPYNMPHVTTGISLFGTCSPWARLDTLNSCIEVATGCTMGAQKRYIHVLGLAVYTIDHIWLRFNHSDQGLCSGPEMRHESA